MPKKLLRISGWLLVGIGLSFWLLAGLSLLMNVMVKSAGERARVRVATFQLEAMQMNEGVRLVDGTRCVLMARRGDSLELFCDLGENVHASAKFRIYELAPYVDSVERP